MNSSRLIIPLGLCILLFHGLLGSCISSRLSGPSECHIKAITAREPNRRQVSEAGFSEFWDSGENDELECAGVEVVRHTINPKGLLLPYYPNTPELVYVVRGQGLQGTVLPGCEETFGTSFPMEGAGGFSDKHQRVYRYKEGDVLALPAGSVHWTYNDGDSQLVVVALRDTSNVANQLDRNFKKFFLAGNPQSQVQEPTEEQHLPSWGRRSIQEEEGNNMFTGFEDDMLQEVFDVDYEIVRQLKGLDDDRGLIVLAENFQVSIPGEMQQHQFLPGVKNGIEQTICSAQLSANIDNPAFANVYNPRGGRISSLNSFNLPILDFLQLSAERGVLYKNAILAPHYNPNAHSIIYIISGSSRVQIVRSDGSAVFDGVVSAGQLIVVPQDFAMIKKAREEGCEWVAFKTNDNAITTPLAGRFSYIHALPEEVLLNSYGISREDAKSLKYSRQEGVVLSPLSRSSSPIKKVKNALLNALF